MKYSGGKTRLLASDPGNTWPIVSDKLTRLNRVKLWRSLAGPAKVRINEINREALIIEGTPLNKLGKLVSGSV